MKKLHKFNAGTIFALVALCYVAYNILLADHAVSISSIIAYAHSLAIEKHIIILGLLPIYIAVVIFGTALLGLYLGSHLQNALHKAIHIGNK